MVGATEHGLEKLIWTDADFDHMGWHDSYIHAFHSGLRPERGEFDFLVDLDYIVRWVHPTPPNLSFSFWVAPATLVFHNAGEITVNIAPGQAQIIVDGLSRTGERLTPAGIITEYRWDFGVISLWATGFTQYFRRTPILTQQQWFELEDRGGISFERGIAE